MPKQLSPDQMSLRLKLTAARSLTTLKHSMQKVVELNELLPQIEMEHMAALQDGRVPPTDAGEILRKMLGDGKDGEDV